MNNPMLNSLENLKTRFQFSGNSIETDAQGYLKNMADWHEAMAPALALQENIILTPDHWEIIYFVRLFYLEFKTSPTMRMLVTAMAQKQGAAKGNSRYLYRLFPENPAKQAAKIAGLPKPAKCL